MTEKLEIMTHDDGFVSLKVRSERDGVIYRSTLWLPRGAATEMAEALRRAAESACDGEVRVDDGRFAVFAGGVGPVSTVGIETHRPDSAPHGGYDTFSVTPQGAREAAALLATL